MFWLSIAFYIIYIYILLLFVIRIIVYIYIFLWYSLYVGSLYNNDTTNTRSANTVGVVLFCPVSNESSTFVALSIFVLYIVYQSRIYLTDSDRVTLYYTSLSSSTVYLFIKTMLCYYARDILYRLCTVIIIIIIIAIQILYLGSVVV